MMPLKTHMKLILGAITLTVLILDTATVFQGASAGIELCLKAVVPALFPLLICTIFLTGNLGVFSSSLLRPLGKLFRIPPNCDGILLTSFLGGYPTGAQAVTQAYESGMISRDTACRMLGFCNNAGPAFIFGILRASFAKVDCLMMLWIIHIISAIIVGLLIPGSYGSNIEKPTYHTLSLPQALSRSIKTMAHICGWIILFRVIIQFLERWILWLIPKYTGILITGFLELTNGCANLNNIESEALRFMMASVLLSAGGFCVGMQTCSVTGNLGTGMYFPGKVMQCCISTLLCGFILPMIYPGTWFLLPSAMALIILVILLYCLHFRKNNSSNFHLQGV